MSEPKPYQAKKLNAIYGDFRSTSLYGTPVEKGQKVAIFQFGHRDFIPRAVVRMPDKETLPLSVPFNSREFPVILQMLNTAWNDPKPNSGKYIGKLKYRDKETSELIQKEIGSLIFGRDDKGICYIGIVTDKDREIFHLTLDVENYRVKGKDLMSDSEGSTLAANAYLLMVTACMNTIYGQNKPLESSVSTASSSENKSKPADKDKIGATDFDLSDIGF